MATGGIFQLITNDGKQDRMLMASELLRTRLAAITAARTANPAIQDPTPTLLDIEKTHIMFTNAHFKPFAAIGFEYNKTTASSGNSQLGSDITFSIPQFGDFFHDMVLYVQLKQPVLTVTAADVSNQPLMRWCPFPGERLLETCEFEVNGNPLDKYYNDDVNFHREFSVAPNKLTGWKRCMGQEETELGFVDQPNWVGSGVAPSSIVHRIATSSHSGDQTPTGQKDVSVYKELLIPLLFWNCGDVRLSVPSVAIPYGQRFIKCSLATGDKLCNLVPRGAGGWTDGTSGVGNIGGSLDYSNMLYNIVLYINNIFVNPEVHNIFIKRIGFTLIRVHRRQTLNADQSSAEVLLNQLKWPIETLFVGMKIKNYNASDSATRRQFLNVWHKFSQVTLTSRAQQGWKAGQTTLKNAAYPVPDGGTTGPTFNNAANSAVLLRLTDTITTATVGTNTFSGIAPGDLITFALTSTNAPAIPASVTVTYQVARVVEAITTAIPSYIEFTATSAAARTAFGTATPIVLTDTATVSVATQASADLTSTVQVATKTVDTITISAHGIPIYNGLNSKFYNAYLPYHFGGANVNTPEDIGAFMINFNLYPGTYQPSGHINVSRAREFYIAYTSSVISTSLVGTLVVVASAINFLLISDGSAVLRYST